MALPVVKLDKDYRERLGGWEQSYALAPRASAIRPRRKSMVSVYWVK